MIRLENISKSFGNINVLNEVNIKINDGEFYLIKGESGKGKSTILNIIGMLEQQTDGNLIIDGNKNPKINKKNGRVLLQEKISYLFQNYGLVDNETIEQNLNMALKFKKISKKNKQIKIEKVLSEVNLDKELNTKIYSLSGGEQQRVAIAKVLLKESQIILCDEPTGSLDANNRDDVIKILLKLKESKKTIVIVSHDPLMEQYADQIYSL